MADQSQKNGFAIGVESNSDMQGSLRDSLVAVGFSEVQIASSIEEVWSMLRQDELPEWIVTSYFDDKKFGTAQLLGTLVEQPDLKSIQVTLLASEDEFKYLPSAFEMSLTSFMKKPFIPDELTNHISSLREMLQNDNASWQIAASQFRTYLITQKMHDDRIRMEQAILDLFSPSVENYVNLCSAQLAAERLQEAAKTIEQTKLVIGESGDEIAQLEKQLTDKGLNLTENQDSFIKNMEIDNILIIESDSSQANSIKSTFEALGASQIEISDSIANAEEWLSENAESVKMIVSSWNLPKISGAGVLQRITETENLGPIPIIITTSGLAHQDKNLLKELGIADILSKPVSEDLLKSSVIKLGRSAFTGHEAQTISRKIQNALRNNKTKMARQLLTKLEKSPDCMTKVFKQREAEVLMAEESFEKAKDAATECFKTYGEDVTTLNVLGKAYLKLGDSNSALKCLNRAHLLSPQNLDRICQMAKTHSEEGNVDASEEFISAAESVDAESKVVQSAKASIAINNGDPETAKKLMAQKSVVRSMISYMNNRAVSLVQIGKIESSLELYQNALEALNEGNDKEKAVVQYNYALACIKLEKVGEAANILSTVEVPEGDAFSQKVLSLRKRVMSALQGNKKVELKTSDQEKKATVSAPPLALHCQPGDLRLHRVYYADESAQPEFVKALSNIPKISSRQEDKLLEEKAS